MSALEVLTLASLDRRVVYSTAGRMEAPHFFPDGASLLYNLGGHLYRVRLPATEPPAAMISCGLIEASPTNTTR